MINYHGPKGCLRYQKGGRTMVSGHLKQSNGYYYVILNYKSSDGKRKTKTIGTGLKDIVSNQRKAEKLLREYKKSFEPPKEAAAAGELSADMLFADYMNAWLEIVKPNIEKTTLSNYITAVKGHIEPYFRDKGITLGKLEPRHIQSFYIHEQQTLCGTTVLHEHARIHCALKYAVKMDLIQSNPADKVDRPKKNKFIAGYYRKEELEELFEATKDDPYSLIIQMTAFYGFRRSEVLGLKWDAIDFDRNTITVKHVVVQTKVDGKLTVLREDRAKTKSSLRSMPLTQYFREKLLEHKAVQDENRRVCGNCYNKEFIGYIFTDPLGNLVRPDTLSEHFHKLLKKHGLRKIRFHDLRHSCASLMLANEIPMKLIQEWLGHSDISTTANIYSHLDYRSKLKSAEAMEKALPMP